MRSKIFDIYYFSGTGNTFSAVKAIQTKLIQKGFNCNLFPIEKNVPAKIDTGHVFGIAFPIAAGSTYPFIWDFVRALPEAKRTEVFMIATMAGIAGGIMTPLKNILIKKGFDPIGAKQIIMPSNIFIIYNPKTNENTFSKGLKSAEKFADDLIDNRTRWPSYPILPSIINYLSLLALNFFKYKWHQKLFLHRLNKSLCTKCALCARICPVHNISLEPYPKLGLGCQYCMRCISYCPEKALKTLYNIGSRTYKAPGSKEMFI